jgi:hypothetical protein
MSVDRLSEVRNVFENMLRGGHSLREAQIYCEGFLAGSEWEKVVWQHPVVSQHDGSKVMMHIGEAQS